MRRTNQHLRHVVLTAGRIAAMGFVKDAAVLCITHEVPEHVAIRVLPKKASAKPKKL